MRASQQRAAPKWHVPSGFLLGKALAALRSLLVRAGTSTLLRSWSVQARIKPLHCPRSEGRRFAASATRRVRPLAGRTQACKPVPLRRRSAMPIEFPASPLPAPILVKMHQVPICEMSSIEWHNVGLRIAENCLETHSIVQIV